MKHGKHFKFFSGIGFGSSQGVRILDMYYAIMKRTRHQYHYSVRRCKLKKKQEIQRTKLAENVLDPTMFWSELNKISSVGKQISHTVGNASGSKEIAQLMINIKHCTIACPLVKMNCVFT